MRATPRFDDLQVDAFDLSSNADALSSGGAGMSCQNLIMVNMTQGQTFRRPVGGLDGCFW